MARSLARSWVSRGLRLILQMASMNLAEVPRWVMPSASAKSNRIAPRRMNGEPSYNSSVAPEARPEASQFHIIQPQVVK